MMLCNTRTRSNSVMGSLSLAGDSHVNEPRGCARRVAQKAFESARPIQIDVVLDAMASATGDGRKTKSVRGPADLPEYNTYNHDSAWNFNFAKYRCRAIVVSGKKPLP